MEIIFLLSCMFIVLSAFLYWINKSIKSIIKNAYDSGYKKGANDTNDLYQSFK